MLHFGILLEVGSNITGAGHNKQGDQEKRKGKKQQKNRAVKHCSVQLPVSTQWRHKGIKASQITHNAIVCSIAGYGWQQRAHESPAFLAPDQEPAGHRWIPITKASIEESVSMKSWSQHFRPCSSAWYHTAAPREQYVVWRWHWSLIPEKNI